MNTKITLVVAAIGLAAGYSSSTTKSANAAASTKTGSELKYKLEEGILLPINYILHEFNYILPTN